MIHILYKLYNIEFKTENFGGKHEMERRFSILNSKITILRVFLDFQYGQNRLYWSVFKILSLQIIFRG